MIKLVREIDTELSNMSRALDSFYNEEPDIEQVKNSLFIIKSRWRVVERDILKPASWIRSSVAYVLRKTADTLWPNNFY